jgi:branched-chain amino acid transport system substrate-binding protein
VKRSAKLIGLILAILMVIPLASACAVKDTSNVKIGSIGPVTGRLAVYGTAVKNGIELAVAEVNAAGGVLGGRQLEVVAYMDDKADSTEAANAYNSLVDKKVVAIIGSVTSGVTAGLATLANQDKMLLLTPTATNDDVTVGLPSVFRACYADSYQSSIAAKFLAETMKVKKVAVLYAAGDAYSSGMYEGFKTAATALGMEIVATESSSGTDAVDFTTQLTNIKASGAEAIFVPYYYDAVGPYIVPQARKAGFKGIMIGADGWDGTDSTMVADKSLYNNTFFTNHYAADDPGTKVQHFVNAYNKKYGEVPNALAALGYDSVYMLVQAINAAKSAKTADIIAAMKKQTFDVVTGNFTLDANNTPTKSCAIIEYVDGKLVWKATVK